MRYLFYLGLFGLLLFEFANVYFIMPLPGSQQWESLDLAYFLHVNRWIIRVGFVAASILGFRSVYVSGNRWKPGSAILVVVAGCAFINFRMAADVMFQQPRYLQFLSKSDFTGSDSMLVVAIEHKGEAKAYPIRYIVYHHQVRDTLGGDPIMVTYCSVCRTGRVFSPILKGKPENFRLVGMDRFNAMFEDARTGSWWQQATGQAITGELKGEKLQEFESVQLTTGAFFNAFPEGRIMAADPNFVSKYDSLGKFEKGKSTSKLTGTDPFSWNEKSWVVGIKIGDQSKAFDWNELMTQRIIQDKVGDQAVVIVVASDSQSFSAFKLGENQTAQWINDTLRMQDGKRYSFTGKALDAGYSDLERVPAYQEFWHSWRTFQPKTLK